MLYAINHDHKGLLWCGPAAIAAVTGHSTSEVMRTVYAESKRTRVMGMYHGEVNRTMLRLGYRGVVERFPQGMTLAEFARKHSADFSKHAMIVATSSHYVVLFGRRFMDSGNRTPVPISQAPYRRARVTWAASWAKVAEPNVPPVVVRVRDNTMAKARRLAAKHGVDIEAERYPDGTCWWVTCPALAGDDDPHEGNQFATSPGEVMEMVEDYVKHLTTGYLEAVTDPALFDQHPALAHLAEPTENRC